MNTRYNGRDYSHNYGTTRSLSNRRCCTAAIAVLCLLGLAGLAVGLYFGITGELLQRRPLVNARERIKLTIIIIPVNTYIGE